MGMRASGQEPAARGQRVEVRIGELVLEGFNAGDRYRIAEGVKRELARLIGEQGLGRLAGSKGQTAKLDAGSFPVSAAPNGGAIGRRIAQTVHRGLTGGRGK